MNDLTIIIIISGAFLGACIACALSSWPKGKPKGKPNNIEYPSTRVINIKTKPRNGTGFFKIIKEVRVEYGVTSDPGIFVRLVLHVYIDNKLHSIYGCWGEFVIFGLMVDGNRYFPSKNPFYNEVIRTNLSSLGG